MFAINHEQQPSSAGYGMSHDDPDRPIARRPIAVSLREQPSITQVEIVQYANVNLRRTRMQVLLDGNIIKSIGNRQNDDRPMNVLRVACDYRSDRKGKLPHHSDLNGCQVPASPDFLI